jgi:hypothetical protein
MSYVTTLAAISLPTFSESLARRRRSYPGSIPLASHADHPSARIDADLMSTTGVPSNASIGPIFKRVARVAL